jgi:uncharacterized protein YjbI with pentapeptide repeats
MLGVGVAVVLAVTALSIGATAAMDAGASGPNVTYFACLSSSGKLTKVGTTAPSCTGSLTQISWNSQGATGATGATGVQGPTGPQGPAGATVNTCTSPPGPGLNFSVCTLSGVIWPATHLAGTLFIDANLSSAQLEIAEAPNADFDFGNLTSTNFNATTLTGAILSQANVTNANFSGALLNGAQLNNMFNVSGVNFSTANLTGADLSSNTLTNTNFTGANVTNANFNGDTVTGTITVTGVIWGNTICPDGTNSNVDGNSCVGHGL